MTRLNLLLSAAVVGVAAAAIAAPNNPEAQADPNKAAVAAPSKADKAADPKADGAAKKAETPEDDGDDDEG